MEYRIHSRDYMRRARERLDEGTPGSIFYAAFELRCGIEARMQQYLEAQNHISNKMKKGWQIAQLAKNIEKAFRTGDKIVEFAIHDRKTGSLLDVLYYTPVSSKLRKMGEQLGNYLHAMRVYRPNDDMWWQTTRSTLEDVYSELQKANIGTLLGVPLLNRRTKNLNMSVEPAEGEDDQFLLQRIGIPGAERMIRVSYLDELPPSVLQRAQLPAPADCLHAHS